MKFPFTSEPAVFRARPNRFRVVATLKSTGQEVHAHCADPGRLRELLIPGVTIHVSRADNPARKTAYDLRFVEHPANGQLVSLDSRVPNALVHSALEKGELAPFSGYGQLRREVVAPRHTGDGTRSRFDFRLTDAAGQVCWVEVKSATLVEEGVARFPDAPTVRGRRHVLELAKLARAGARAAVIFIIQRPDATHIEPKWETDPDFGAALVDAAAAGVELHAYRCHLTVNTITIAGKVPVQLARP